MKKLFIITAAVFYLLLSIGVRVNAHYCGDELSSISFFGLDPKSCCDVKEVASKCCKDKVAYLQITDAQEQNPSFTFSPLNSEFWLAPSFQIIFHLSNIKLDTNFSNLTYTYAKYRVPKIPVFIELHSLRV